MHSILLRLIELRDLLSHHPLFTIGFLLVVGYFIGKIATKFHLPEITGYIFAGIILGRTALGIVSHEMGESLTIITEVALGLIALTIGGEFAWSKLKRMGADVVLITVVQIVATIAAVFFGLILFKMPIPFAILLGVIASATAPAATVAIVQSLRARGPFVDYLYGVVALDDAGCVILFGIAFAVVSGSFPSAGGQVHSQWHIIQHAFLEVAISIGAGALAGVCLHFLIRNIRNKNEIFIFSLGFLFIINATAIVFHLSPLLTNMAAGAILINASLDNLRVFSSIRQMTPPIYALFFVIAGTELNPAVLIRKEILVFGSIYVVLRALGKYLGVYSACAIRKLPKSLKNNLGYCMLPQAGVALGLVLLIEASPIIHNIPEDQVHYISLMVNIVLLSVFINEIFGPPLAKMAVSRGIKER
ncbi:cation:proton antiporter [bacterium]|nr:cation:proton antiporter [bacterium]